MQLILFALFSSVLIGSYVTIRREIAPPGMTAGACVIGSIITMALFMFSLGAELFHGIIVGIIIGGLFAGAVLSIAWYFYSNERRAGHARRDDYREGEYQDEYLE